MLDLFSSTQSSSLLAESSATLIEVSLMFVRRIDETISDLPFLRSFSLSSGVLFLLGVAIWIRLRRSGNGHGALALRRRGSFSESEIGASVDDAKPSNRWKGIN